MLEAFERVIDGEAWKVTLLPTTKGLDIGRRLLKLVGPAFGTAVGAVGPEGILDADVGKLGAALGSLSEKLGEPDAAALVKELVTTGVFLNDAPLTVGSFEVVFQGKYATLLQVAMFVIEVNYKIPLASWLTAVRARAAVPKMSTAPTPVPAEK